MGRKVDYFISSQVAPTEAACVFVALDAQFVPALVRGLSAYLGRAFWVSDTDAARGYQATAQTMEAILNDCGEFIVNNLIAARGIDPAAPRDPTTGVPLASPQGSTLLDIFTTLQGTASGPGALLDRIAAATETTASNVAEGLGVGSADGLLLELLLAAI